MHNVFHEKDGKEQVMVQRLFVCFVLVFLLVSCNSPSAKEEGRTYRIGYMICNSDQETLSRFRPLTAFLSKKLGVRFEAVAIDTIEFAKEVDKVDFTHTNSLLYIILNRNHGVEVLAAEKAGPLGARSKGAIVALKRKGFNNLKDLKGKTMVFGPMLAPTGYMTQIDLMLKSGMDPEKDLAFYAIPAGSFKHEKVIYSVLFDKYDAGAFPMLDFERMAEGGKIDRNDFIIIAEGAPIPYCNFGVTQKVEESLARRFKGAVLDLKRDDTVEIDGEVVRVFDRAQIDGYEDVKDSDFNVVREMAKRTNMPPYQKY
ncbi:MAG TPA: phosphate/phosphite/phosphonate ABC transporter substrate-binding protein [Thermodesulfovibrionales bacterium]|nr:phosphate/phosphite/phosphonate ABC transporter substrate-binding protein [Thermodesulfovibrionales bacterium]